MKWLSRSLWIAAWSFWLWLWLGFGLYRELPRDLGPVVCTLPLGKNESFVGVMESPQSAVTLARLEGNRTVVRIRDLSTGEIAKEMPGPISRPEDKIPNWFSPTCGFLLTVKSPDRPIGWSSTATNYSALDLATGRWRPLNVSGDMHLELHQSKPLAMFHKMGEGFHLKELAIIDLRTSDCLFTRPSIDGPNAKADFKFCEFIGEDQFVLAFRERNHVGADRTRIELWSLENPVAPMAVHLGVDVGASESATTNGLFAWHPVLRHSEEFKVYDPSANRFVFDNCMPHDDAWHFHGGIFNSHEPLVIAADGKSCLNPLAGMIMDLERGTPRWRLKPMEVEHILFDIRPDAALSDHEKLGVTCLEEIDGVDGRGWFQVREIWVVCFRPWVRTTTTYAIRDASDGTLAYRLWKPLPFDHSSNVRYTEPRVTADRQWLVNDNGNVYRLPPRANYPLLALCQIILALPLVLLWAVLRWRRKRRMRMASVQP